MLCQFNIFLLTVHSWSPLYFTHELYIKNQIICTIFFLYVVFYFLIAVLLKLIFLVNMIYILLYPYRDEKL